MINLGLEEYWPQFATNSYTEARDLADLKHMDRDTIKTLFNIEKEGHFKRLILAISALQYPTKGTHPLKTYIDILLYRFRSSSAKIHS